MPRSYEEFHADKKTTACSAFTDAANLKKKQVEKSQIQQTSAKTDQAERQERIDQEKARVFAERSAPHPQPSYASRANLSEASIHQEAVKRVEAQIATEQVDAGLHKQSETADRQTVAENTVTVHSAKPEPKMSEEAKNSFKAKMHEIVDDAQQRRKEASRTFIQNRKALIEESRELGSETPERDASIAQREVHKIINEDEHKHLHSLFQEHGWDYDKQNVQFLEEETTTFQNTQETENTHTPSQNTDQSNDQ